MGGARRFTKRSLAIAGHRTSISLEDAFWQELGAIAARQGVPVAALVAAVDRDRADANLSSAIRLFVLARVKEDARPVPSADAASSHADAHPATHLTHDPGANPA